MVFHPLSSWRAGDGALPAPPTRLSRIAAVAAASPLLVAGSPAQAFVEISALAIAIVLLAMAWPVIQLVLLAVIVWLVRRRPGRRILLYSLIALSVAGTSLFAVVAGPDLLRSLASYRAERYWQRVAEAARPMRLAELDQVWAERGPQGPQDYLVHLVQRPHEPLPDDVVLAHLFQRCADLFLHRGLGEDRVHGCRLSA